MSTTHCVNNSQIRPEAILEHLQVLLLDRRFASAERNARFLRHVVTRALEGRADEIKETVIGCEVYGRSSDYDPKTDSIVRVEASRLRQKLRSYYENEGGSTAIRIHLPSGSYVPQFEAVDAPPQSPEPDPEAVDSVEAPWPLQEQTRKLSRATVKPFTIVAAVAILAAMLSLSIASASRIGAEPHEPEAVAAWQEGVALLQQDPHSGTTGPGAPRTLLRAIERLEFAVARSPRFPQAWATLSEAYDYATAYTGRDFTEDARRAEAAARQSIALDEKFAPGHHMLALGLGSVKWDFQQSELEYKRTLALEPNNVYAVVEYADLLRKTGRVRQAAEVIRHSRALLPALPPLAVKEAEIQLDLGRADAALATAKSAIDLKQNYLRAYVAAGSAYEMKGDFQQAIAHYEHVLLASPSERRALPALGYLLGRTGETARAQDILARLERMHSTVRNVAFQIAVVHVGLGQDEKALDWLEQAWRTRQAHFPFAAVEYRFRGLHQNPRFRELLKRVELRPVNAAS